MSVISIGRGRPRKTTAQKQLEGTARADRAIEAEIDARPIALPSPPRHLSKSEKKVWRAFKKVLDPLRIITDSDVPIVVMIVETWTRYRQACEELASSTLIVDDLLVDGRVRKKKNPLVTIIQEERRALSELFTRIGWSPADRSRVTSLGGETKRDPLAEFADDAG